MQSQKKRHGELKKLHLHTHTKCIRARKKDVHMFQTRQLIIACWRQSFREVLRSLQVFVVEDRRFM